MRAAYVIGLIALLCPAVVSTRTTAAPGASATADRPAPRRGGDITRDQYIERAKEAAARRFDRMDTDHDGILTAAERRAYREAHSRRHRAAAGPAAAKMSQ
ncbi:MAG TPA: hypothetical protein VME41_04250 [Stellaceae bacterium]|nr:hypothetical protein [Stellaceae bacterium]